MLDLATLRRYRAVAVQQLLELTRRRQAILATFRKQRLALDRKIDAYSLTIARLEHEQSAPQAKPQGLGDNPAQRDGVST